MLEYIKKLADWLKTTKFSKTKLGRFIVDVLIELLGVTWPAKDEIKTSTLVVMVTLILVASYMWLVTILIGYGLEAVYSLTNGGAI